MISPWQLYPAIFLATFAGVGAIYAYSMLSWQAGHARKTAWTAYFSTLLVTEVLFTVIYTISLLFPTSNLLPTWLVTGYFLFGVPISVALPAYGWLFAFRKNSYLKASLQGELEKALVRELENE